MSQTVQSGRPSESPTPPAAARRAGWIWPLLRVLFVMAAGLLAWQIAQNWDRWTGALRYVETDDANITGDLTPLAAKVSGYISRVPMRDFQVVQKGDLLVEIEPSDYEAQATQADANVLAAQAVLANLANQKDIQRSVIRQAEATIDATNADLVRYHLEAERQRNLNRDRLAGTPQAQEEAEDNEKRAEAQLVLNRAQLD